MSDEFVITASDVGRVAFDREGKAWRIIGFDPEDPYQPVLLGGIVTDHQDGYDFEGAPDRHQTNGLFLEVESKHDLIAFADYTPRRHLTIPDAAKLLSEHVPADIIGPTLDYLRESGLYEKRTSQSTDASS